MIGKDTFNSTKERVATIRARTWTLTSAIVVALVFYFLITITTNQTINWVDFFLLGVAQVVCHILYFPDGELFGQKDSAYVSNKKAYNEKATKINQNGEIAKLREYCKIEYEERKQRYILNECGIIGITLEELELLKQKTEEEIKELKVFETTEIVDGKETTKKIVFSKFKKARLYKLVFDKIPIEPNQPETIMSAIENNGRKAIHDNSIGYKLKSYIRKTLQAFIVGGFFAYVGYKVRDGIGLEEIISIIMYLTALFTTAVLSFTRGETCSKVYKSRFYLELSNFIDGFNEWNKTPHQIEIINPSEQEQQDQESE